LIKQHFPHIHVTIGGNTVTRLRDVLPQSPLFQYFDSAVVYEGETAFRAAGVCGGGEAEPG
jgi:hypothetical protein